MATSWLVLDLNIDEPVDFTQHFGPRRPELSGMISIDALHENTLAKGVYRS
jgi:hypothetical protein